MSLIEPGESYADAMQSSEGDQSLQAAISAEYITKLEAELASAAKLVFDANARIADLEAHLERIYF